MGDWVIRDGELYHYGVLGMKWGVRRGKYSSAYAKSSKKLNSMDRKANATRLKAAKLSKKALSKEVHARNERTYRKAREIQYKANKLNLKSARLQNRAMKFEKKMAATFKTVKVSDIDPKALEVGRKYAYMLMGGDADDKKRKG